MRKQIVILGAGFAGLALAEELDSLAASGSADVILVERNLHFSMGFSMQWALAGRRTFQEGQRPYTSLRAKHVQFLRDDITAIDTTEQFVRTRTQQLPYDELIITLGAELAPALVPGLADAAHNLCDAFSIMKLKDAVDALRQGTVLIAIAAVPFKCPPSPYEYAFLIEDMLQKRGVRGAVRLIVTTPEPQPMPVAGKRVGIIMKNLLAERGIEFLPEHKPRSIDATLHTVTYENGAVLSFDLLCAMPPHRAPTVVREAGLTNTTGFVPVDLATLQTSLPHVYAVGDVAALTLPNGKPHPKAGIFAEAQGRAVARAIIRELCGGEGEPYTGRGACYVDTGKEQAATVEAELLAEGGPRFHFHDPSEAGLAAKAKFEREHFQRWFGGNEDSVSAKS